METTAVPDTSSLDAGLTSAARRFPIVIVGAGISGLALAAWLREEGIQPLVIEAASHPGGVMRSTKVGEFLFECGPNTILDKSPSVNRLIEIAGLESEALRVPIKNQERYIWLDRKLRALPTNPADMLGTKLLSFGAKARLMREPLIAAVDHDETLRDFVIRRLGEEAYHRACVPMVQGIWAGDPAKMSTAASFPILKDLERAEGSLVKGLMKRAKSEAPKGPGANMLNFRGGLRRLPEALAAGLGESYWPEARVVSVAPRHDNPGYALTINRASESFEVLADQLTLTGDAAAVASLVECFEPELSARMKTVHYSPLVSIGLGVEASSLRVPPGFGFLVVRDQGLRILGGIFASNILPDRAPKDHVALTIMIGGDLDPDALDLDDAALIELLRRDLKSALQWNGDIKALHIERWRRAIPRYGIDHFENMKAIELAESRRPGLNFIGNWRGGASISERIDLAREKARSLATQLRKAAQ